MVAGDTGQSSLRAAGHRATQLWALLPVSYREERRQVLQEEEQDVGVLAGDSGPKQRREPGESLHSQIQSCTSQDKHSPEPNLRTRAAKICIYILSCSFGKDIVGVWIFSDFIYLGQINW